MLHLELFSFKISSFEHLLRKVNQQTIKTNAYSSIIFTSFTIFANVARSAHGHLQIHHGGYTYGLKNLKYMNKEKIVWKCTGSETGTRKRCPATVQTLKTDGYTMLKLRNTNHICFRPDNVKLLNEC